MIFKTSDLAICADVSQFTIRDYSDQGLLGPIPRSSNSSYRTFDPRLVSQIYLIKTLRESGCSQQQIRAFGQNRSPENTLELFRGCSARLSDEIASLQARTDVLQSYISLIEEGLRTKPGGLALCVLPERPIRYSSILNGSGKLKDIEYLRRAHGQIRNSGNPGCPLGYAYSDFSDLLNPLARPAQLISFDPQGPDVRPAGKYLVGTVACYYGEKNGLAYRMRDWAQRNNLQLNGPAYAVYLLDAASVTEPEQYLLQIAVQAVQLENS